ncbi:MAG: YhbY family RNA-binding protein [Bacillota bacterium]
MLDSKQRSFLRGLGQELKPVVFIGKSGVTRDVVAQCDDVLEARELIKGRVLPNSGLTARDASRVLAEQTEAEVVQVIGRNFILCRTSRKSRLALP